MKNNWKKFAEICNVPYNKRFSTNGYGDMRINNRGLYIYKISEEDFYGYWYEDYYWNGDMMQGLLDGEIKVGEKCDG